MIEFKRVDHFHICVPAKKLEEAKWFYTEIIGLKQIERPDHLFSSEGYWFKIGDAELHIGVEPKSRRTIRHTALQIADIISAKKYLIANGVEIVEEPVIPGRIRFAFIDPFGNRMELLQLDKE
ncbi:VOC family protein [Mucilaginibacter segetis]|uniref:VOC family protein n=1 Tax=Mucilaginibacter segetis TaxID=2793071 RepID=A0A934PV84_9SPHI|nr:VOC family protein [Mucilaginibacter segetis]MBK0380176.1 VOC family protein [Mucilaginibacter segetis]